MTNNKKGDTISSSEFVKSLRGVGKRYPVRENTDSKSFGNHIQLDTSKNIEQIDVFAGKGTKKEIRNRRFLESNFHIPAEEWQKCSAKGHVIIDGKSVKVELHWYQARGIRTDLKMKPTRATAPKE